MSTNHNRIKVADLETNQENKILTTNENGEIQFSDINTIQVDSYNGLDYNVEGKALDARQGKALKDLVDNKVDKVTGARLINAVEIATINNQTGINTGDQDLTNLVTLNTDQILSGVKTFLSGKLGFRNVVNTFTSFFTNANTASRTYTLQNRNGILLDDTDLSTINTNLATKQSVFAGVTNFLSKSLNSTTLGASRIQDTGSFFGIDTYYAPTKDLTLGNQKNKEIGIEESDNISVGRDLSLSAGRTVNYPVATPQPYNVSAYAPSITFQSIFTDFSSNTYLLSNYQPLYRQAGGTGNFITHYTPGNCNMSSGSVSPTGKMYVGFSIYLGGISRIISKAGGTGSDVTEYTGTSSGLIYYLCCHSNGNVYCAIKGGDILMQTNQTGSFVPLGQTGRQWSAITFDPSNGDVYATVNGGDIYKQTGGSGNFVALSQTVRAYTGIAFSAVGDAYVCVKGGDIYKRSVGTSTFIALGFTPKSWGALAFNTNGNLIMLETGVDVYFLNLQAFGTANLDGGILKNKAGTGKGTGKSRIEFYTGQKTTSGTDMQLDTLRSYIDENGYMIWVNMPVYTTNSTAITAGLPLGAEYRTPTGERRIVY